MTSSGVAKRRGPLIAAVLVILALAAVTAWVRRPADVNAPLATQGSEDSAGVAANSGPEGEGTDMGAARRNRVAAATSPEDMQKRIDQSIERRARLREQSERNSTQAMSTQVAAYRSERVDPAWAPQKEGELSKIAASPEISLANVAPQSLDVDCKRTICRLTGSFASAGAAEDWTLYYMSSVGAALPNPVVSRSQNPDGSTRVEIYGRAR